MFITLLVAQTEDGFICDAFGNGNFSSAEDKQHLRGFLRSPACDCFICGRKTAQEFQEYLTYKPMFVFTKNKQKVQENRAYFSTQEELFALLKQQNLTAPALLGGAETYHFFLKKGLVNKAFVTTEKVLFHQGKPFDFSLYEKDFCLKQQEQLSSNTLVKCYDYK